MAKRVIAGYVVAGFLVYNIDIYLNYDSSTDGPFFVVL